ncbi:MAG: hypothetical protein NC226_02350, partial [Bacteroides cellulosilyticus]|nr:hypothetical protein [Bacteroides cellulosilyticus]
DPNLGKVVLYQLSYFRIFINSVGMLTAVTANATSLHRPLIKDTRILSEHGCKGRQIFRISKQFRKTIATNRKISE